MIELLVVRRLVDCLKRCVHGMEWTTGLTGTMAATVKSDAFGLELAAER